MVKTTVRNLQEFLALDHFTKITYYQGKLVAAAIQCTQCHM